MNRRLAVAATIAWALAAPVGTAVPAAADTLTTDAVAPADAGTTVEIAVLGDSTLGAAAVDRATGGAGEVVGTLDALGATLVAVPAAHATAARSRLDALPGVDAAYRPGTVRAHLVPDDPFWPSQEFNVAPLGLPAAWDTTTGSSGVVIAVLDSGVDAVADLAGRVLPGANFVTPGGSTADDFGHGTRSALVAAGRGNDGAGGAGVCWECRILPVKVLDSEGYGALFEVAQGIVWAADQGADVINLSLGGRDDDAMIRQALAYAYARDVVVVASAGNDGGTTPNYPAANQGVIGVAALAPSNIGLAPWSARGATWVDLAAPGCNLVVVGGTASPFCGTSSSAPLVAGLAGLVRSTRPDATREMVATAMVTTAGLGDYRGLVGYGVVHAGRSVASAATVMPGPTPWPLDVTPPAVAIDPIGGYRGGVTSVRVHSSDDQRVAVVRLLVGGAIVAEQYNPPGATDLWVDTRGHGDGPLDVQAQVIDGAHHVVTASATMTVDNAAPLGLLYSPTTFTTVTGSFVAKAVVTDPNGVMGTYIVANDRIVGGWPGGGFGQVTVPVGSNGPIRVAAISVDNALRISATNVAVVKGVAPRRRR